MKVQLLIVYMERADDPLKRPPPTAKGRSRAVYKNDANMSDIYEQTMITLDSGRQVALSSICRPDFVHNCLASGQLTGQSSFGLAALIDEVMDGVARTKDNLKEKKEEIIALARSLCLEESSSESE